MNKIQTILLSTGVLLTTASATVLSHTFLVAPHNNPVESQRDTGEVQLVRTPVESQVSSPVVNEFSGKTVGGYELSFTRDNVRTSVDDVPYHSPANLPEGYRVTERPSSVQVIANGVVTDLTGQKEHYSGEEYCEIGDTVVTRYYHNVHVVAESFYFGPERIDNRGVSIGSEYIETQEDLGVMSIEEYEQLSTPKVKYVIKEHFKSYDHNDTQIIPGKYINSESLICESAKTFNLI